MEMDRALKARVMLLRIEQLREIVRRLDPKSDASLTVMGQMQATPLQTMNPSRDLGFDPKIQVAYEAAVLADYRKQLREVEETLQAL